MPRPRTPRQPRCAAPLRAALAAVLASAGAAACTPTRAPDAAKLEAAPRSDAPGTAEPASTLDAPTDGPEVAPPAIELLAEAAGQGFVPVLLQRDAAPVRLRSALVVERRRGEAWQALPDAQAALRFDCTRAPEPCLSLAPGAELRPPAWPGQGGAAQCDCPGCAHATAGEYRFVARGCDQNYRVTSKPFAVQ